MRFNKKNVLFILSILIVAILISSCGKTTKEDLKLINLLQEAKENKFYVDAIDGNDLNDGKSKNKAFKTLSKAKEIVRTVNQEMTENIYVILDDGVYFLPESVVFSEEDSGKNGFQVFYCGNGVSQPIISGGEKLNNQWVLHDENKNIYKMSNVTGSFRQLYVDDEWATCARTPNKINDKTAGDYFSFSTSVYPYLINKDYIGDWAKNSNTEFVWNAHWSQIRARIADYSISGDKAVINFENPEANFTINHHSQTNSFFYLENNYNLLDQENEWFCDAETQTLYYKPQSDVDISTLEFIIPRTEVLFDINGGNGKVENLTFYGLEFMHNNWTEADNYGYVSVQAGILIETNSTGPEIGDGIYSPITGAVTLKNASYISFERCRFTNGGSWGIMQTINCDNNIYVGNVFKYLASGAIAIGNREAVSESLGMPSGEAAGTVIKNNLIDSVGYYYRDTPAIIALRPNNLVISHNEIRNVPYTGISVGWEWDDSGNQDAYNNIISHNRIHNAMELLEDGAGIYVLGRQDNSIMSNNYVYNLRKSRYSGNYDISAYYFDSGSCYWLFEKNISDNVLKLVYSGNEPNHDNVGKDNYYNYIMRGNIDGFESWTDEHIFYNKKWSDDANRIISESGIEPEYWDIGNISTGENIALNSIVSVSLITEGSDPKNSIDNRVTHAWLSSDEEKTPWIQYDLQDCYRIYEICIVASQKGDYPNSRKNIRIEASNDVEFKNAEKLAYIDEESAFDAYSNYSIAIEDSNKYQYIRVIREGTSGQFGFAEIQIFGVK